MKKLLKNIERIAMKAIVTRTKEGIMAEIRDLKNAISKEEEYLKTGNRLGTYHHPRQRIAAYKIAIEVRTRQLTA
jgi:hypothetical protein